MTKANSPAWLSRIASSSRSARCMRKMVASTKSTAILTQTKPATRRGDAQRIGEQHRKGDRHADGDEEQAEQQALERLEIAFELVAVFAVGQQHAAEEGAEGRGEADASGSEARRR